MVYSRNNRIYRAGLTLLELVIILAVVAAIVFIAIPTLQPTQEEAYLEHVKDNLKYLAAREQEYFMRHGTYAPLKKLAEDETVGIGFDGRFAVENPVVNGVKYQGPITEDGFFDITAELPDGTKYKIDHTQKVVPFT